ncbi:MAG: hypothetical protein HGA90_01235 [Alphaproteobacteria bacterium]|nr:hypothetical protein [Alphaproteobacteria bacterium]
MPVSRATRRGPVTVVKLTLVTLLCIGLATTLNVSTNNTSSSRKTKTPVAAQTTAAPAPAVEPVLPIDADMGVLAPAQAPLYRRLFEAQKKGDWALADATLAQLGDKRLLGHVLADRYQHRPASLEELTAWLRNYADLPMAEEIYAEARRLARRQKTSVALHAPQVGDLWSGGTDDDTAADFSVLHPVFAQGFMTGIGSAIPDCVPSPTQPLPALRHSAHGLAERPCRCGRGTDRGCCASPCQDKSGRNL